MAWIKRNLYFVIFLVVGAGLVGWAGWYLYGGFKLDQSASDELKQAQSDYSSMSMKNPYPSDDHIAQAKDQVKELQGFTQTMRKLEQPPPAAPKMDDQRFVGYLRTTVGDWQKQSAEAGVSLPDAYYFSFAAVSNALSFSNNSTAQWLPQIQDLSLILKVVFNSHLDSLDGIRRVPVAPEDVGAVDFLATSAKTNDWGICVPYEITFHASSAQLGLLTDGLQRATNCLVLRNIDVLPGKDDAGQTGAAAPGPASAVYNPYAAAMRQRPAPTAVTPTAHPSTPQTILSATKLRVVAVVDVVKLKP